MLGLCRAHVGGMLGRAGRRAYVVPMLGLYWPYGEPCWPKLGPWSGHVEPKFGNLADFRPA